MPEHPFCVEGTGRTEASDLQIGDPIRKADGTTGEVELIEIKETSQEMYNLTVDTAHTFYVGEGQWLVHNTCRPLISIEKVWPNYKFSNEFYDFLDTTKHIQNKMPAQDYFKLFPNAEFGIYHHKGIPQVQWNTMIGNAEFRLKWQQHNFVKGGVPQIQFRNTWKLSPNEAANSALNYLQSGYGYRPGNDWYLNVADGMAAHNLDAHIISSTTHSGLSRITWNRIDNYDDFFEYLDSMLAYKNAIRP